MRMLARVGAAVVAMQRTHLYSACSRGLECILRITTQNTGHLDLEKLRDFSEFRPLRKLTVSCTPLRFAVKRRMNPHSDLQGGANYYTRNSNSNPEEIPERFQLQPAHSLES